MRKLLLLSVMLLAGCAVNPPQDCDLNAEDPSFLTKLGCSTSGGYRQKITEQEQQVTQNQQENEQAKINLKNTETKQKASSQQVAVNEHD